MNGLNGRKQDDAIVVDVRFGAISFMKKDAATFANVTVAVTFEGETAASGEDDMNLDISFPADPESETIVTIVEKSRLAVIERLKAAALLIEGMSARALLFGESR